MKKFLKYKIYSKVRCLYSINTRVMSLKRPKFKRLKKAVIRRYRFSKVKFKCRRYRVKKKKIYKNESWIFRFIISESKGDYGVKTKEIPYKPYIRKKNFNKNKKKKYNKNTKKNFKRKNNDKKFNPNNRNINKGREDFVKKTYDRKKRY